VPLNNLSWAEGEPNGELLRQNCLLYDQSSEVYFDLFCKYKFCSICQLDEEPIFKLKGLCGKQTIIDTDYIFLYGQVSISSTFYARLFCTNLVLAAFSSQVWLWQKFVQKNAPVKR